MVVDSRLLFLQYGRFLSCPSWKVLCRLALVQRPSRRAEDYRADRKVSLLSPTKIPKNQILSSCASPKHSMCQEKLWWSPTSSAFLSILPRAFSARFFPVEALLYGNASCGWRGCWTTWRRHHILGPNKHMGFHLCASSDDPWGSKVMQTCADRINRRSPSSLCVSLGASTSRTLTRTSFHTLVWCMEHFSYLFASLILSL